MMIGFIYASVSNNEWNENHRSLLFIYNEVSINHYNENQETKSASVKL